MARAAPIQYNRPARKIMIFRGIKKLEIPTCFCYCKILGVLKKREIPTCFSYCQIFGGIKM